LLFQGRCSASETAIKPNAARRFRGKIRRPHLDLIHRGAAYHSDEWRFVTMTTHKSSSPNPTAKWDIETLSALGIRLADHLERLGAEPEFEDVAADLKLAVRALDKFSSMRFRLAEIAARALIEDGGVIRRDLLLLIDNGDVLQLAGGC
jgi:hypothetical protein